MRGFTGVNGNPPETRHRLAGNFIAASKKRSLGCHDFKQAKKQLNHLLPEKNICKLRFLKLVLVIVLTGIFLALLHSPIAYHNEHFLHHVSRADLRYASNLDVEWVQILKAVQRLDARIGHLKVGLLNFNVSEVNHWQQILPHAGFSRIHLNPVQSNVTWDVLYPEWIDEEEESEVPVCPHLPEPKVSRGLHFDLIAVKLPCNSSGQWTRDVARLHLQLAAAKVALESAKSGNPVYVLIVTTCFPIPNLFTCKNLVKREGNAWLYKPNLKLLKEKLQLPVGSCELALPLNVKERKYLKTSKREAYATILHSANVYACGAIAAAQSIRLVGSKRDLVILVDETVSKHHRSGLAAAGWKIKTIKRIRNPKAERDAYNEWNYSKFRLWQLTEYDKIIFIDADLLILRNIDFLFTMPEITATGNNATLFNSGVMVVEPSNSMRSSHGGTAFRST